MVVEGVVDEPPFETLGERNFYASSVRHGARLGNLHISADHLRFFHLVREDELRHPDRVGVQVEVVSRRRLQARVVPVKLRAERVK